MLECLHQNLPQNRSRKSIGNPKEKAIHSVSVCSNDLMFLLPHVVVWIKKERKEERKKERRRKERRRNERRRKERSAFKLCLDHPVYLLLQTFNDAHGDRFMCRFLFKCVSEKKMKVKNWTYLYV